MEKINWKIVNASFWIEIVLSYLLPFQVKDTFQYQVGFPVPFMTLYDAKFGVNLFTSTHLNPVSLLFDGIVIYVIISFCIKTYHKFKSGHAK